MPTDPPFLLVRKWLTGCFIHWEVPQRAPEANVEIRGQSHCAPLDSVGTVTLVHEKILSPQVISNIRVNIRMGAESRPVEAGILKDIQNMGVGSFGKEPKKDGSLKRCWGQVRRIEGEDIHPAPHPLPHYIVQNDLFYCVAQWSGAEKQLLVVLKKKTETILELARSHLLAGHLGARNTIEQIRYWFHWLGLNAEVKMFCQGCRNCHLTPWTVVKVRPGA